MNGLFNPAEVGQCVAGTARRQYVAWSLEEGQQTSAFFTGMKTDQNNFAVVVERLVSNEPDSMGAQLIHQLKEQARGAGVDRLFVQFNPLADGLGVWMTEHRPCDMPSGSPFAIVEVDLTKVELIAEADIPRKIQYRIRWDYKGQEILAVFDILQLADKTTTSNVHLLQVNDAGIGCDTASMGAGFQLMSQLRELAHGAGSEKLVLGFNPQNKRLAELLSRRKGYKSAPLASSRDDFAIIEIDLKAPETEAVVAAEAAVPALAAPMKRHKDQVDIAKYEVAFDAYQEIVGAFDFSNPAHTARIVDLLELTEGHYFEDVLLNTRFELTYGAAGEPQLQHTVLVEVAPDMLDARPSLLFPELAIEREIERQTGLSLEAFAALFLRETHLGKIIDSPMRAQDLLVRFPGLDPECLEYGSTRYWVKYLGILHTTSYTPLQFELGTRAKMALEFKTATPERQAELIEEAKRLKSPDEITPEMRQAPGQENVWNNALVRILQEHDNQITLSDLLTALDGTGVKASDIFQAVKKGKLRVPQDVGLSYDFSLGPKLLALIDKKEGRLPLAEEVSLAASSHQLISSDAGTEVVLPAVLAEAEAPSALPEPAHKIKTEKLFGRLEYAVVATGIALNAALLTCPDSERFHETTGIRREDELFKEANSRLHDALTETSEEKQERVFREWEERYARDEVLRKKAKKRTKIEGLLAIPGNPFPSAVLQGTDQAETAAKALRRRMEKTGVTAALLVGLNLFNPESASASETARARFERCKIDTTCQLLQVVHPESSFKILVKDKDGSMIDADLLNELSPSIDKTESLVICQEDPSGSQCTPIEFPAEMTENILSFLKEKRPSSDWSCSRFAAAAHGITITSMTDFAEKFYIPIEQPVKLMPGDMIGLLNDEGDMYHAALVLSEENNLYLSKNGSEELHMHRADPTKKRLLLRPVTAEMKHQMQENDWKPGGFFKEIKGQMQDRGWVSGYFFMRRPSILAILLARPSGTAEPEIDSELAINSLSQYAWIDIPARIVDMEERWKSEEYSESLTAEDMVDLRTRVQKTAARNSADDVALLMAAHPFISGLSAASLLAAPMTPGIEESQMAIEAKLKAQHWSAQKEAIDDAVMMKLNQWARISSGQGVPVPFSQNELDQMYQDVQQSVLFAEDIRIAKHRAYYLFARAEHEAWKANQEAEAEAKALSIEMAADPSSSIAPEKTIAEALRRGLSVIAVALTSMSALTAPSAEAVGGAGGMRTRPEILYRGDTRSAESIFRDGFKAWNPKLFNVEHDEMDMRRNSRAYISSSAKAEVAIGFSIGPYFGDIAREGRFVYVLNAVPEARCYEEAYDKTDFAECVVPVRIESKDIKGAWKVEITRGDLSISEDEILDCVEGRGCANPRISWIPNPHFVPREALVSMEDARAEAEALPLAVAADPFPSASLASQASPSASLVSVPAIETRRNPLLPLHGVVPDEFQLFPDEEVPAVVRYERPLAGYEGAAPIEIPLPHLANPPVEDEAVLAEPRQQPQQPLLPGHRAVPIQIQVPAVEDGDDRIPDRNPKLPGGGAEPAHFHAPPAHAPIGIPHEIQHPSGVGVAPIEFQVPAIQGVPAAVPNEVPAFPWHVSAPQPSEIDAIQQQLAAGVVACLSQSSLESQAAGALLTTAYNMMEAIAGTPVVSNPNWVQYASTVLSMGRTIVNVARSTTPAGVVSQLAQAAITAAMPSILRAANSNIPGVMTGLRTAASIAMTSIGLVAGNAQAGSPIAILRTPSGVQALNALRATILRVAEAYAPIPRGPGRAALPRTPAVRTVARSASRPGASARHSAPGAGMSRAQQDALAAGWIFERPSTCLDRVLDGPSAAPYGTITNALRSGSGAVVTDGRGNPILAGDAAIIDLVQASRGPASNNTDLACREAESQTALGLGLFNSAMATLQRSAAEGGAITSFYARAMDDARTASNQAVASLAPYTGPTLNWSGRSGTYGHARSENLAGVTTSWFESSGWGSAVFSRSSFKATERSGGRGSSRDRRR